MKQIETYATLDSYLDSIQKNDHKIPNVSWVINDIENESYEYDRIAFKRSDNPELFSVIESNGWNHSMENEVSLKELGQIKWYELIEGIKGNTAITSFNEFKYFTGVTLITNETFSGCTNISEITLPESVTEIETGAFDSLSQDAKIHYNEKVPQTISSFTYDVIIKFENANSSTIFCSGTTDSIKTILDVIRVSGNNFNFFIKSEDFSGNTFNNLPSGSSLTGTVYVEYYFKQNSESGVTIPNFFYNNSKGVYAEITGNIKKIGNQCFLNAQLLTSITVSNNVSYIGTDAFFGTPWFNTGCQIYGNIYYPNDCIAYKAVNSGITECTIKAGTLYISDSCFNTCSALTSISVPDSVKEIGNSAFYHTPLTSITLGSGLTKIGENSFRWCNFSALTIPDSVTEIAGYCFADCKYLETVNLSQSLTALSYDVFMDDGLLRSITIPDSITEIGTGCFSNCSGLTSVTFGSGLETISSYGFSGCKSLTNVVIPSNVRIVENNSFSGCGNLTSVTLSNSLEEISDNCFTGSGLREVAIPNGVKKIGWEAFRNCIDLTSVTISDTVTTLYGECFAYCMDIVNLTIGSGLTSINTKSGTYAPFGIYTSQGLLIECLKINSQNFVNRSDFSLKEIIGSLNIEVYDEIICGGKIYVYDNIAYLPYRTNIAGEINIPEGVVQIGVSASHGSFSNQSGITRATLPSTIRRIENYCFAYCTNLTDITIPSGLTYIGAYAFSGCTSLTGITFPDSITYVGRQSLEGTPYIESGYCQTYGNLFYLNNLIAYSVVYRTSDNFQFKTGTKTIAGGCFASCTTISSITIPNTIENIGDYCFGECHNLKEITLPVNITIIPAYCFYRCMSLKNVVIPNSVIEIGQGCFDSCTTISSIAIPNTITKINNHTFGNCINLKNITIPNTVTAITMYAFSHSGIENIIIPDSVKIVENSFGAFANCSSLTSVTVGSGITKLPMSYFSGCTNLTNVIFRGEIEEFTYNCFYGCKSLSFSGISFLSNTYPVHTISSGAFAYCTNFIDITIPDCVNYIGRDAFYGCSNLTGVTIGPGFIDTDYNLGYGSFSGCNNIKVFCTKSDNPYGVSQAISTYYLTDKVKVICKKEFEEHFKTYLASNNKIEVKSAFL